MHLVLARVGKSRSRLGINVRSSVGYNMYSLFENNVVSHVLSTPVFIIDMTLADVYGEFHTSRMC